MVRHINKSSWGAMLTLVLVLAAGLMPGVGFAKGGGDGDRTSFRGWVERMPDGLHGTWVIGGQEVTTAPQTEFDQDDGPLKVGGCVEVKIRGGVVHEIDSEPESDCR